MKRTVLILIMIMMMTVTAKADEVPTIPRCDELDALLPVEVQNFLWAKCVEHGIDYEFAIAIIETESEFNPAAYNGHDRGLMQVNKCWIKKMKKFGWIETADDLFDPYKNIVCGIYVLDDAVKNYGNTEKAYAYYNTGNPNVNSNKASRKVMRLWECWESKLFKGLE